VKQRHFPHAAKQCHSRPEYPADEPGQVQLPDKIQNVHFQPDVLVEFAVKHQGIRKHDDVQYEDSGDQQKYAMECRGLAEVMAPEGARVHWRKEVEDGKETQIQHQRSATFAPWYGTSVIQSV
jgi:hypothetical protein